MLKHNSLPAEHSGLYLKCAMAPVGSLDLPDLSRLLAGEEHIM